MVEIGVSKSEGLVSYVVRDKGFVLKQETSTCVRGSSIVATNVLIEKLSSALLSLKHIIDYDKYDVSDGVKIEITSKSLFGMLKGGAIKEHYREQMDGLISALNKIPTTVTVVCVQTKHSIAKKYLTESCLARTESVKSKNDLAPTLSFTDIF